MYKDKIRELLEWISIHQQTTGCNYCSWEEYIEPSELEEAIGVIFNWPEIALYGWKYVRDKERSEAEDEDADQFTN